MTGGTVSAKTNLASLVVVHVMTLSAGLAAFPLALRALGAEQYANVVLAEAIILLFLPVVLYGFDILAVRDILGRDPAIREDHAAARMLSGILRARMLLLAVVLVIVLIVAMLIDPGLLPYAAAWLLVLVGWGLQPNWFFQVRQNHLPLAIITTVSRVGMIVLLLLLVKGPDDALTFALIFGGAVAGTGLVSLIYAFHVLREERFDDSFGLRKLLRDGSTMFASGFGIGLFRGTGVMFLGLLGVAAEGIAVFSLCEKITKAVQASVRPLNQFFLPRIVNLLVKHGSSTSAFHSVLKMMAPQVAFVICVWCVIAIGIKTTDLVAFLGVETQEGLALLSKGLVIMSLATMFGVGNFVFGSTALNAIARERFFLIAVIAVGLVSVPISIVLINAFNVTGAYIAFTLGELLLLVLVIAGFLHAPKSRPPKSRDESRPP